MWTVPLPPEAAHSVYQSRIRGIRDPDLKDRLGRAAESVTKADVSYRQAGAEGMCGRLAPADFQLPDVTAKEENTPVVQFAVQPPESWPSGLADRVHRHFVTFGIGPLYSMQAARLISGIHGRLDLLLCHGGPAAVRDHLRQDEESWLQASLNSWQAACYNALTASEWFCAGGFRY
jgi:hypothetical protein